MITGPGPSPFFARSFARLIQALGGRGIIDRLHLSGIGLVALLPDVMNQTYQTSSATLTATAINTASLEVGITEDGFYEVTLSLGNLNAHAAGVRWSLRLRDESDTVIWFGTAVLGTAIGDNITPIKENLFIRNGWDLILFNGDALAAGESVFGAIVLIKRLQE